MSTARASLSDPDLAARMRKHTVPPQRAHPLQNPTSRSGDLAYKHTIHRKASLASPTAVSTPAVHTPQQPTAAVPEVETIAPPQQTEHIPVDEPINTDQAETTIARQFNGLVLTAPPAKVRRSKVLNRLAFGLLAIAFVAAGIVGARSYLENLAPQNQVVVLADTDFAVDAQGVAQGTGDNPAEDRVTEDALIAYQTEGELPRYVRIPSIDVFARVKPTSSTSSGTIEAPTNINDVGWYDQSVRPGSASGSSILVGHVQGWTADGAFRNIDKLGSNDIFIIEKGSGETIKYTVTKVETVDADVDLNSLLRGADPINHDVKLITHMPGSDSRNAASERVIVYANVVTQW